MPVSPEPWPRTDGAPRRAAVCSYGYGGTIAHLLLEEAPLWVAPKSTEIVAPVVFPLSGRSEARVGRQAGALAALLRARAHPLGSVAATLWTRRSHEPGRAALVAQHRDELLAALDALAAGRPDPAVVTGAALAGAAAGAVWVFSGHGSHWPGMGRELLAAEPAFAAVIDEIEPVFAAELGFSARTALRSGELGGTDRVQALTFAMQVGLAAVLRERGVAPAAVIGHSVGEVAACVVAGVFDLAQGAAVACYRARGFRSVQGAGAMALVRLPFAEAARRLAGHDDVVAAISASPESTVVSGAVGAVEEVCRSWAADGVTVRRVNTDVAFHSPAMDALTGELARLVGGLPAPRPAAVPLYSTALNDPRSQATRGPDYWVANLRGRVRFAEAVSAAAEDGHRLFLEVSAHPVVAHSVAETLLHGGVDDHAVFGVLRRDHPELRAVSTAVAALHCHGAPVAAGFGPAWAQDLPGTQWQHRRFWRTPTAPPGGRGVHDVESHTLLGGRTEITGAAPAWVWQTRLDMSTRPYPGDHPVQGTEIVPAAVLLNTFLTAAGADLADVRLRTPVPPGRPRDLQVVLQDRALSVATRLVEDDASDDATGGWLTHCTAVAAADEGPGVQVLDEDAIRLRCTQMLPSDQVVTTLADLGVAAMGFGWEVRELLRGPDELFARVAAESGEGLPGSWASLIDAATSAASTVFDGPARLRMPARIERVQVFDKPPAVALLHVRRRPGGTVTDVSIAEESGTVAVALTGMAFEELENSADPAADRLLHHVTWQPVVHRPDDALPTEVVLLGGDGASRAFALRDLDAARVRHRVVDDPAALPADLAPGGVVLVLPRDGETPLAATQFVLHTLQRLHDTGAPVRLWVLSSGVHEGVTVSQAPLWGLARVAAAEHPELWGGVLDVDADRLPVSVLGALHGNAVIVVRDGVAYAARLAAAPPGEGAALSCAPGGTYLITGGTGVLGLLLAQRLADLGARRLVLVSRSGLPDRADWDHDSATVAAVSALESRGVSVHVAAIDVGAPGAVEDLRAVLRDLPAVRGVVHAAGVEAGALLSNTTPADIEAAMRPKVDGGLALHELFGPGELDWMVLFSSCGYLAGFPGQGAYACGNAFLDALARHRRALGDRTTSVAWTAWRGLGMGSDSGFVAAQLEALGMGTVGADEALHALDLALRDENPNVVVLPVLPAAAAVPILAGVAPAERSDPAIVAAAGGSADRGDLDLADWVSRQVLTAVAGELGQSEDDLDPRLPLVEVGVDSIMTVALRRRLEKQTGLPLPATLLWEHPTAAAVIDRLVELLSEAAPMEVC